MVEDAHPGGSFVIFDDLAHADSPQAAEPFSAYQRQQYASISFFVCLGYRHLDAKLEIVEWLQSADCHVPSLVHPTAHVHGTAQIGPGVVVYPMCNIDTGSRIGAGAILHNSVVVSHDTEVGAGAYLAPGVITSGFVTIGQRTFVGTGSVVADGVSVGSDARVGIGTAVTRDVEGATSVIGNPMRVLDSPLRLDR